MDPQSLVGTELSGYKITRLLGEGGMAWVYRGENTLNRRILRALKVLKPSLSEYEEFGRRFVREAAVLEQIQHANVMRFYGVRLDGPWMVMELELLEGAPLSEHIPAGGFRDVDRAVRWMALAADGVAAAHALEVVHRDIKPDNIFVTADDQVKVVDFGIARAIDEANRITRTRTAVGTPAYTAPEIILGEKPSRRTDVYGIGLTLWEMLLGAHPLVPAGGAKAVTEWKIIESVVKGTPAPLRGVRDDVPPGLEILLGKAISKRPADRHADAAELARALHALGTPGASRGPVPPPEARSAPQHHTEIRDLPSFGRPKRP